MIAIIDYGVGNLFSLSRSFEAIGQNVTVTSDAEIIKKAEKIVLPGVGAFEDAAAKLKASGLGDLVISEAKKGKLLLGICLGMQLLFEKSYEYGCFEGLGLIKGSVTPIKDRIPEDLKVPHMGWNALTFGKEKHELFKYLNEGDCAYFVHSFSAVDCEKNIIASTEYGTDITAAVADKNIMGCQFHPEKSGDVGLSILRAFCEMKEG